MYHVSAQGVDERMINVIIIIIMMMMMFTYLIFNTETTTKVTSGRRRVNKRTDLQSYASLVFEDE